MLANSSQSAQGTRRIQLCWAVILPDLDLVRPSIPLSLYLSIYLSILLLTLTLTLTLAAKSLAGAIQTQHVCTEAALTACSGLGGGTKVCVWCGGTGCQPSSQLQTATTASDQTTATRCATTHQRTTPQQAGVVMAWRTVLEAEHNIATASYKDTCRNVGPIHSNTLGSCDKPAHADADDPPVCPFLDEGPFTTRPLPVGI